MPGCAVSGSRGRSRVGVDMMLESAISPLAQPNADIRGRLRAALAGV